MGIGGTMKFKLIKHTQDYRVMNNYDKLIGFITQRETGFYFLPKGDDFLGMTPDKTLEDCKKRAEVFYEIYAPHFKEN